VPVVAPVERRLGGRRVFGSFAAAHVGATLLVAGGIWVGVRSGRISSIELVRDVGVS
jgi:hypothetical protein